MDTCGDSPQGASYLVYELWRPANDVCFLFLNITRCAASVRVRGHVPLFRKMRNNKTTIELTFTPSLVHAEAKMLDKDGCWVTRLLAGG